MAARSTGIFPREGFNLDNAFAVFAIATEAPINMRNCRTLRVTLINPVATGDGIVGVSMVALSSRTMPLIQLLRMAASSFTSVATV